MKKITLLLFLYSCFSFGQLHKIQQKSLEKTLNYLASDQLKGRKIGSEGIEKAAQFIEHSLKKSGLKPYYQTYRDSFDFKNKVGYNIVAYKEGDNPNLKNQIVLIGAHYDHIGILPPIKGDSIANGANDDASGTAAILEIAKYFAKRKTKRSMLFVLFSGEEVGLVGSSHLAKRLKNENVSLYTMLEYEMIGVPLKNKDYSAYITGYKLTNLAKKFNQYTGKNVLGYLPTAQMYQLFKRSDNYPFYRQFRVPAQAISTFDFTNFNYYHKVGDEVNLVNFKAMKNLIEESLPGIEGIVNSENHEIKMLK